MPDLAEKYTTLFMHGINDLLPALPLLFCEQAGNARNTRGSCRDGSNDEESIHVTLEQALQRKIKLTLLQ